MTKEESRVRGLIGKPVRFPFYGQPITVLLLGVDPPTIRIRYTKDVWVTVLWSDGYIGSYLRKLREVQEAKP